MPLFPLNLLLALLILGLVFWAARALMRAFGVTDPIATVVYVLLVLLTVSWLLQILWTTTLPWPRLR